MKDFQGKVVAGEPQTLSSEPKNENSKSDDSFNLTDVDISELSEQSIAIGVTGSGLKEIADTPDSRRSALEEQLKTLRRDSSWKKHELRKHEFYVGPSKKSQLKSLEAAKHRKKYY